MAHTLLKKHQLHEWCFKFDHAKRRFGCCNYSNSVISLSRHLTRLNDEDEVRDTLLHEIAHALTPGDGHGRKWKAKCLEIGAKPERCYQAEEVEQTLAPYYLYCKHCGIEQPRFRRSRRIVACRDCCNRYNSGKFSDDFQLHWREAS